MTHTKSKIETPRDYQFPTISSLTSPINPTIKPQVWCLTTSINSGDIAIQTTTGDYLVLCSFQLNSTQQQVFTRLQSSDLTQI